MLRTNFRFESKWKHSVKGRKLILDGSKKMQHQSFNGNPSTTVTKVSHSKSRTLASNLIPQTGLLMANKDGEILKETDWTILVSMNSLNFMTKMICHWQPFCNNEEAGNSNDKVQNKSQTVINLIL